MAFYLYKTPFQVADNPQPKTVVAGAAVTVGQLVVLAGDDGKYDPVADNGVKVSGIALTAASGDTVAFKMLPIVPGVEYLAPFTGTWNVNLLGSLTSINASQVVDLDDAGNDLCQLVDCYGNTLANKYDLAAATCVVRFPATVCVEVGAEV